MEQNAVSAMTDSGIIGWAKATPEECFAEAEARIECELLAKTGRIYLGDLNRLIVLPPTISQLEHLFELDIGYTAIHNLTPLAQLSSLQSLDCGFTEVSELTPLAQLSSLQSLDCFDTQVSDLSPLAQLSALQSLDCSKTQVSDLTPLAQLSALQSLDCSETGVSDLTPLAQLSALQSLDCGYTQVSDLTPLAQLSSLQSLDCGYTQVSDLTPLAQLSSLQSLDCSHTQVSDLTPLAQLSSLQSLDCGYTQVLELTPLAQLSSLQSLDCGYTQVSELTPLAQLSSLQSLDCRRTQVSDLIPLEQLSSLQSLDCSETGVSDLTPLAQLSSLQSLDCRRTQVSDLIPLEQLSALQSLNCSQTKVSDLTPLAKLSALQSLYCNHTQVSDLTPLAQLSALQSLVCGFTQVSDLTPLAQLSALQSLECNGTQVKNLTPLAKLSALQSLKCSGTQVKYLTPLAQLSALQSLEFSETQVSDLTPLAQLSALQSLVCGFTQVSDLTPLAQLSEVQKLDISECNIQSWNASLIWGKAFQNLITYRTTLNQIPSEVLSSDWKENCLPNLRAHLRDLEAGSVTASSVKLILLGNGTVGKTQLCQRLRGLDYDPAISSTHGVQVHSHSNGGVEGEWHIWDFGGQDIYHSTHALFLRTRAVFVLVWSPGTEQASTHEIDGMSFRNHPLAYWVDYVRHTAGLACPLLIVQTRCEHIKDEAHQLPLSQGLLDDFAWYKPVQYSSLNNRGWAALDEALGYAHARLLEQHPTNIGKGRMRVQQALCSWRDADNLLSAPEKQHRLVTQAEFAELCAQGHGDVSDPTALLHYLHHAGIVFYQANLFDQQIILDQGWALDAIYTVFNREKCWPLLRDLHGRFTRSLLASLIWSGYSQAEQELFLSMMCSCGVAFVYSEGDYTRNIETRYIAPDLLPGKAEVLAELEEKWDDAAPCLKAQVHYSVHQPGLLRSIVAKIGSVAGINGLYWQGGVCVYEKNTRSRALIEQIANTGVGTWHGDIRISTQGGNADQLLAALKEELERETSDWTIQMKHELSPQAATPPTPLEFSAEPVNSVQYAVSYNWENNSNDVVDRLCKDAEARGISILRDKTSVGIGDSLSQFMQRLAVQDRIFVILSDSYLKSHNCMYELFQIWRDCKGKDKQFLSRIRVYRMPDADIFSIDKRLEYASYWKTKYNKLDQSFQTGDADIIGVQGHIIYSRMRDFYSNIGDILTLVADTLLPNSFEQLVENGFK
ncbi:leucine-rich repeat domain-containing protein [Undibacterium umbellatum]|uniref:Leucine-rich repeat domain-containing protein n=1 Tax=Undibacterium umbellatum TaxID=2762300 RepID=A0ABR6ZGX1_9BURK|nr:leucine-rich repeat domain-containing protein [Undibacterium umbellatum]MBC3910934.1 leucine-rich repeat domain-containing protein [Undibacterium umbellatum]